VLSVSTLDIPISPIFQAEIIWRSLQFQSIQFAKAGFVQFPLSIPSLLLVVLSASTCLGHPHLSNLPSRFILVSPCDSKPSDLQKPSFFGFPLQFQA
jgi:hypothetical protein